MPDEVRCPGCGHLRDGDECHGVPTDRKMCNCTLTLAEIDAVLAMRANNLAVADTAGSARPGARHEAVSVGHTAPAGDGKKPGPTCENCQDTGWVSTDVPGRAGPLVNVCPKNCAAGQREFAAVLQNQRIPPSSTPLVSCEGCGIVRNAAIVRDPDVCPSCGVVGRQPVVT